MKQTFAKRPPRPDARQHWEPFIRLPKEWETVKQALLHRETAENESFEDTQLYVYTQHFTKVEPSI